MISVALAVLLVAAAAGAQSAGWDELIAAGVKAYREGRLVDAERYFAGALAVAEGPTPRRWDLVVGLAKLADAVSAQGRQEDAEALYRQALTVAEELRGNEHPSLLDPIKGLALFYVRNRRYAQAERLFERALALSQRNHDRETAAYLHLISDLSRAQGKYTEAESLVRQALVLLERSGGTDERGLGALGAALSDLVTLLRIQGKIAESEATAERAEKSFVQDFEKVEPLVRQALASRSQLLGPQNPALVNSLHYLARLLESRKRYDDAEPLYQRALEILTNVDGPADLTLAVSLEMYGALLRKMGRENEARIREARAAAIRVAAERQEAATVLEEKVRERR